MKKFAFSIVLFLIPIFLIFCLLEYKLSNYPISYRLKMEQLNSQKDNIQTIILGNSHSFEGINPDFLDEQAYNLANAGQDLYTDFALLQKYISSFPRLKSVVINVSYNSLYSGFYKKLRGYERAYIYQRLYNIPTEFEELSLKAHSWVALFGFEKALKMCLSNGQSTVHNNGYKETFHNKKELASINSTVYVKSYVEKYHANMSKEDLNKNKVLLRKIIELCQSKNLKVYLVTLPNSSTFINYIDDEYYSQWQDVMKSYQEQFTIPYINRLKNHNYGLNDFRNSNHLSNNGAEKFTKELNIFMQTHQ